MTVQNIVNLAGTDRVAYRLPVCRLNFTDFHKLAFLGSCLKRGKYLSLFRKAQITVIAAIMIPGDRFQPFVPVFATSVVTYAAWKPVACATSLDFMPSARSSNAFNLASARLSLFSLRAAFIAAISSLLNLYLDAIFITQI